MNLWLNGERVEMDGAQTIADLARRLGLAPHTVLIEQNGAALHQREWTERRVRDDDRIEFVRVVAGG
ncbi:MAG: sulfur carrier protein ThiS [Chthoniobacterales bacterium]